MIQHGFSAGKSVLNYT